jgi:hypothetical protein
VSYRPDAHQTKASSVRTFLYVEKLRTAPACIHPDVSVARPDDPQCSTKASGFLSKTQIWEDCCNHPDDMDSRPDALIHKASIAIQIQRSERQSTSSGRACIRNGNCVHQISRPNDHPPSLDARSLYMEITCSRRATVQTTWVTVRTQLSNRKDFQRNSQNFGRTIVGPNGQCPPSGRRPV